VLAYSRSDISTGAVPVPGEHRSRLVKSSRARGGLTGREDPRAGADRNLALWNAIVILNPSGGEALAGHTVSDNYPRLNLASRHALPQMARRVQLSGSMSSRHTLAGALLLLAASISTAQSPSADWKTIETAHFRIHFPRPFEAWARRVATRIELIHTRVTEYVGYVPTRPIDVVVEDPGAAANGVAFPFLDRPVILLWTTAPESESSLVYFGDWPDLALTHEMTHIVHLVRPRSQSRGLFNRFTPLPFGSILRKSPRWVIEGYATLVESALAGSDRPRTGFRAMIVRRFAAEGTLPEYKNLNSIADWSGGGAPYLVGATFLEWLEARAGHGSLQRLWTRMGSKGGGGFSKSFRAVFGEEPKELYQLFRTETTNRAIEEEHRLRAPGIVQGELWASLGGATASPQVSPDGKFLLARIDAGPGKGGILVWEVGAPSAPDLPRAPRYVLSSINGYATSQPRWMPDGKSVLFSRRSPDADGVLRSDLFVWSLKSNSIRRLSREADVAMADPSPDGSFLVGVSSRYGISRLVRIETRTGRVQDLRADLESDDPWRAWIHPRVSPDGRRVAVLLHSGARWRLMLVELDKDEMREVQLSGSPVGPPAWDRQYGRLLVGVDTGGIWNIESISIGGAAEPVTRTTGGAFGAAPTPDGREIFYLDATSHGFDLRRMPLGSAGQLPASPRPAQEAPVLPPATTMTSSSPAPPALSVHGYRSGEAQVARFYLAQTLGPSGSTVQAGLEGSDVIGRFHWLALGSVGTVSGPRGGSALLAYRGWPVTLRAQIFDAIEKPGSQNVLERPEFDQSRRGAFAEGLWQRAIDGGTMRLSAGAGTSRVEALNSQEVFRRDLATIRFEGSVERSRGRRGIILDWDFTGSAGRTDGFDWSQALAGARATALISKIKLRFSGRFGQTSGEPTLFDLFSVGGAASSIFPEGLDRNRLFVPALPAATQFGRKAADWRAEIAPYSLPMSIFYEESNAWTSGEERPPAVKIYGAEMRFDVSLLPLNSLGTFDFYAGIARIDSRQPSLASTRLYAGIVYHP
jgi:WD40 repeat protein